jgi:hypothetical protein
MPSFGSLAPHLCFGRDAFCEETVAAAYETGAVLLFGGRQAGKTSVLRKIAADLGAARYCPDALVEARLPVYVNLLELPYDATPARLFGLLSTLANAAYIRQVEGGAAQQLREAATDGTLESLLGDLKHLREGAGNLDLSFLFLLDESKRILGDRFPRGFVDNIFAFLYGDADAAGTCPIVFAGAQELYDLCEDGTSPIGSRAARKILTNLPPRAVEEIILAAQPDLDRTVATRWACAIHDETGGHPGLSTRLARRLRECAGDDPGEVNRRIEETRGEFRGLFEIWIRRLSREARAIHDALLARESMDQSELLRHLRSVGVDLFRLDRARDELVFTGIAGREGNHLVANNRAYRIVARDYVVEEPVGEPERTVWGLIEQVELGLRQLISERFVARWGTHTVEKYQQCLGNEGWAGILERREKYKIQYPRSATGADVDVLTFSYFGQLVQLVLWGGAWDMFKHMFRDRRELEDMSRVVCPVRNDQAHFRPVPPRELDRCRIACEDLLAIIESELDKDS